MKNKIILGHSYSFGCLKSFLMILLICVLFSVVISAQTNADTTKKVVEQDISLKADSTVYNDYQVQKEKLIQSIVQKQSELYEATEALKNYYNNLSALNIAIQGLEEKFKLYKQMNQKKE